MKTVVSWKNTQVCTYTQ